MTEGLIIKQYIIVEGLWFVGLVLSISATGCFLTSLLLRLVGKWFQ